MPRRIGACAQKFSVSLSRVCAGVIEQKYGGHRHNHCDCTTDPYAYSSDIGVTDTSDTTREAGKHEAEAYQRNHNRHDRNPHLGPEHHDGPTAQKDWYGKQYTNQFDEEKFDFLHGGNATGTT